jgi:F-type H+-transporting ATPase subunit alpha
MSLEAQVIEIFAGTQGFADQIPLERMRAWEVSLTRFMESSYRDIAKSIAEERRITPEIEPRLRQALDAFTASWQ